MASESDGLSRPLSGALRKLVSSAEAANAVGPVEYWLPVGERKIALNPQLGKKITLVYDGTISCIGCGRATNKSFSQGYCYPCFKGKAACDICILKPELCHFDAGTCREPQWAIDHCMQPHIVYLANTTGVKVGITRRSQLPTRWIDQGAVAALPLWQVSKRLFAGEIEVALAQHVADKSRWQQLLKGAPDPIDLQAVAQQARDWAAPVIQQLRDQHGADAVIDAELPEHGFGYPVREYPTKIKSFNFDKQTEVEGVLHGIKGQYLLLDGGVINIRKFGGYQVTVSIAG